MSNQHTPGPWHVAGERCAVEVRAYNGKRLFGVRLTDLVCMMSHHPGQQEQTTAKANARLIAAAPVLKEALYLTLSNLEEAHADELAADHYGDGPDGCSYCAAIAQARAALEQTEEIDP